MNVPLYKDLRLLGFTEYVNDYGFKFRVLPSLFEIVSAGYTTLNDVISFKGLMVIDVHLFYVISQVLVWFCEFLIMLFGMLYEIQLRCKILSVW